MAANALDSAFGLSPTAVNAARTAGILALFGYGGPGAYHVWTPSEWGTVRSAQMRPMYIWVPTLNLSEDPNQAAHDAVGSAAALGIYGSVLLDTENVMLRWAGWSRIVSWVNQFTTTVRSLGCAAPVYDGAGYVPAGDSALHVEWGKNVLPGAGFACQYGPNPAPLFNGLVAPGQVDVDIFDPAYPLSSWVPPTPSSGHAMLTNCVGMVPTPDGRGYWLIQADGGVFTHGDSPFLGSAGGAHLNRPIVGACGHPTAGYALTGADGGVFTYGVPFEGSASNLPLAKPIVGIAASLSGNGYWLVAVDGGVFSYGDAPFFGSAGSTHLNAPIVGMARSGSSNGYWLAAADGGVFSYGAPFYGSASTLPLVKPIVGMAATPDGGGYWLVASDGGVFSFGDAGFFGSAGSTHLNAPIVGMASSPSGHGYWLVAADGGVFTFGDAGFYGSGQ